MIKPLTMRLGGLSFSDLLVLVQFSFHLYLHFDKFSLAGAMVNGLSKSALLLFTLKYAVPYASNDYAHYLILCSRHVRYRRPLRHILN